MEKGIDELRHDLRIGILEMQQSCLAHLQAVIDGKKAISDVTKEASKMLGRCQRVDQETRLERENAVGLSLRYINLLDGDSEARAKYMERTAPHLPAPIKGLPSPKTKTKK